MSKPRLAVLISGAGRNLQAIIEACQTGALPAEPVVVLSNRPGAGGLRRAAAAGVTTEVVDHTLFGSRAAFDQALAQCLESYRPDLVALAGFMRVLTPDFTRRFQGRMLNIHPSLLPKYRGLHTHRRVLEAGDAWHGASVHFVTEELDGGPVIMQGRLAVQCGDTEASLAARLMQEVELCLYPAALSWVARGRLQLAGSTVLLDGIALQQPLQYPQEVNQ